MVGLAVCSVVTQVVTLRAARTPPAARLGSSPDGLPMVSIVAGGARVASAFFAIGWTALATAAAAVLAFSTDNTALGVLLTVLAAAAAGYLVVPATRGLRGARVEMTPQWLATERFGARWQVPWTSVGGSVPPSGPGQPVAVVVHAGATPERRSGGRAGRSSPPALPASWPCPPGSSLSTLRCSPGSSPSAPTTRACVLSWAPLLPRTGTGGHLSSSGRPHA